VEGGPLLVRLISKLLWRSTRHPVSHRRLNRALADPDNSGGYSTGMNMRDVANRARVSSATVSRVINGSPLVTEATKKRVQAILDEVGFIPNPSATTLKYGRSKTFGLIVPDICNPFYAEFLGVFEHLLRGIEHEVLFTNVEDDETLVSSVRRMLMRQVDGVILMASELDTRAIEPLLLHKVPVVTVDRRAVQNGCSDVAIDFEFGFREAVKHLKELGHRQIGFIGGTKGLKTSRIRSEAFQRGLQQHGLIYKPEFVRIGDYRIESGEVALRSLWESRRRPSAVLTVNDLTAFGVIRGAHRMGLVMPKHLSVVGVDDVLLATVIQPELTTIRIPRQRMADVCLEALTYTKQHVQRRGKQFSVPTELIIRGSTISMIRTKRPGKR
jgi:DNA-binding LacI/PurR family transcriptional regulator